MSDRIAGMLAQFRTAAEERADAARIDIAELEAQLERARQELAAEEAELAQLAAHETLQAGTAREIAPGDVQSAEGILGMLIGTLAVAPPDNATVEQLRAYANAMRALTEQANHQAVIATNRMHELEREAEAAIGVLVASGRRAVTPNREEIRPEQCEACETTGYNCSAHGGRPGTRNYRNPVDPAHDPLEPLPPNVVDARPAAPTLSEACATAPPGTEHACPGCGCGCHVFTVPADPEDQDEEVARCS